MKNEKKDSDMNPTFKSQNENHGVVRCDETAEDFFGMHFSYYLNGVVTSYLTSASVWNDVVNVAEHAEIAKWDAVAVMLGYDDAGVMTGKRLVDPTADVDDAPDYEHHCRWLVDLSNARVMRRMLLSLEDKTEEDNENLCEGNGWLFWENQLWFDPTNEAVRSIVESCEIALSDYPLVGEDHHSVLEHEYLDMMAEAQWSEWSRYCDDSIDEDEVKNKFIDDNRDGSLCPSCGFTTDMDDAIRELYGECGCNEFTADTNDEGEPECADCREEREAEETEEEEEEEEYSSESWIGEHVTEGLLSGYRLVVTQDVDAENPTTWGDHVTENSAIYQQWVQGDVSVVSMEKMVTYINEDDPGDIVLIWRSMRALSGCYLDKEYTPLIVARENRWEGVDYTNDN